MDDLYQQLVRLVRGAWRYRWHAVVVSWVVALAGTGIVAMQRDVYEASARVYVDTASQLRLLLDDQIVDSNIEDQLQFVREALLGRDRLARIAQEVGLLEPGSTELETQQVVSALSGSIQIIGNAELNPQRRYSARTDDTYLIQYQAHDRRTAISVVSKILTGFVEDTRGAKRSSSQEAGAFISEQLQDYEERLRKAEEALAEFNRAHFDRLPSMQGGYFQSLQQAREQLAESEQSLRLAESRLDSIEQQLTGEAPRVNPQGQLDPNSIEARILEAKRRLEDLQLRYTDQHPDVVASKEILAQLEARMQELYSATDGQTTASNNPVFQALQISRNEARSEVAALNAQVQQRRARVEELQELIDEMPRVEAQRAQLNRDYDVIHAHYQSLLNSLEREKLSREVLESEELEFRIIDQPSAPLEPVAPRRMLFTFAVILMSLGVGALSAHVLNQLRPVIQDLDELYRFEGATPIGAVSMQTELQFGSHQIRSVLLIALAVLAMCVIAMGIAVIDPLEFVRR